MRGILYFILAMLLILVVGSVILEEFPTVQPLWEELKGHIVTIYNMLIVKYGAITTICIIVAVFLLVGSSSRKF